MSNQSSGPDESLPVAASVPEAALPVSEGVRSPRRRRVGLVAAVAGAALLLDIVTKVLVVAKLQPGEPHKLLGGAVYLLLTRNSGAAFSVGTGATIILTGIAVVVVAVIVRAARRLYSGAWAVSFGLILGGACGNLVDRFLRAPGPGRGHVVDFISVFSRDGTGWPVFNVADSAICCGAVLAGLLALRGIEFDGGRAREKQTSRADA